MKHERSLKHAHSCPKTSARDGARHLAGALSALLGLAVSITGARPVAAQFAALVAKDSAAVLAAGRKIKDSGRVAAADLAHGKAGKVLVGSSAEPLAAGAYRLHVPLALSPLGDLRLSALAVDIIAPNAKRSVGVLNFATADEFVDFTLDFTLSEPKRAAFAVNWSLASVQAEQNKVAALVLPDDPDAKESENLNRDDGAEVMSSVDGTISAAAWKQIPLRLAARGAVIEKLPDVAIDSVRVDKVVYQPGDTGIASVILKNYAAQPGQIQLTTALVTGLQNKTQLAGEQITLAPGQTKELKIPFSLANLYWGGEIQVTVRSTEGLTATARDVFAVSRNFWETALVRGLNYTQMYADPAKARAAIDEWREQGYTAFESGFWAPDDFGGFVPKTDLFLSGHMQYRGSTSGTKNLLRFAHEQGMRGALYTILSLGSGEAGFDLMRRHPNWFVGGSYATDWLEMYPAATAGKVHMGELWIITYLNHSDDSSLKHHAAELVKTHREIGWDAARYDVWDPDKVTLAATPKVRQWVAAGAPEFQWGYNTEVPAAAKANALDTMVDGGGLVMEESVRGYSKRSGPLSAYANTIISYRDMVWPHKGHLGTCYDGAANQDVDEIYMSAIQLAAGSHPFYGALERKTGQFARFALRYSDFLFNNKMTPLAKPEAAIQLGSEASLMEWKRLARNVDLGGGKRRLIIHLLNIPPNYQTLKNAALVTPAPLRNLPVAVTLPPGAQVTGAYNLCPTPDAGHTALPFQATATSVKLTVPEVRFWNVIVIDYHAAEGL